MFLVIFHKTLNKIPHISINCNYAARTCKNTAFAAEKHIRRDFVNSQPHKQIAKDMIKDGADTKKDVRAVR
jgi:hypothetical protein